MLKGQTKLEKERQKKREMVEDEEYLKEVDKSGGWKFVQQTEKAKEKKEQTEEAEVLTDLERKKSLRFSYIRELAGFLQAGVDKIDWDGGWEVTAIPTWGRSIRIYGQGIETKEGVVLVAKSPDGRVFLKAWGVCFDPIQDRQNMVMLAEQAENTLDNEKGLLLTGKDKVTGMKKTKSGIILP